MNGTMLRGEERLERDRQAAVDAAVRRLGAKADHLLARATRARYGSNERARCVGVARHLRACAGLLATDGRIQDRVRDTGLLDAGWKALADEITRLWQASQKTVPGDRRG